MKIAALITAKGTSELKNKNLLKINKRPIIWYPCNEAKKVNDIKKFFVSSEDNKILNLCEKYGYKKIKRTKHLSKPNSKHENVLKHTINYFKSHNYFPDIIVVLLGNAPTIKKKWIADCIKKIKKNKNITSVVPVMLNNDHNPLRAKKIKKNILVNFIHSKKKISSNRQQLPKSYFLCHNFWVIRTKEIIKNNGDQPWSFMGKKVAPYIIDKSIDIHTMDDFHLAKIILKN